MNSERTAEGNFGFKNFNLTSGLIDKEIKQRTQKPQNRLIVNGLILLFKKIYKKVSKKSKPTIQI